MFSHQKNFFGAKKVLFFLDLAKAYITCPQEVKLTENENFSCWCKGIGVRILSSLTWLKSGKLLGQPSSTNQQLSLPNVSKDASGTYVCRAQYNSLVAEKTTEIIVQCK